MQIQLKAKAIIIENGNLIVCKHPNNTKYQFPGGKKEINETIDECIVREILEETGIPVNKEDYKLIYIYEKIEDTRHIIEYIYLIKDTNKFLKINTANASHAFEIEEFKQIKLNKYKEHKIKRKIIIEDLLSKYLLDINKQKEVKYYKKIITN